MLEPMDRGLRLLLAVVLGGALVACGGHNSGGGGVVPQTCLEFDAAAATAAGTIAAEPGSGSSCDLVAVDLIVNGVNGIFAVDLAVDYDPMIANYDGLSTSGSVLTSDGAQVQSLVSDTSGHVLIGVTRLGVTTGVNAVGDQRLLRLLFRRVAGSGNSAMTFSQNVLLDAQAPPQPIGGLTWHGGTLAVR